MYAYEFTSTLNSSGSYLVIVDVEIEVSNVVMYVVIDVHSILDRKFLETTVGQRTWENILGCPLSCSERKSSERLGGEESNVISTYTRCIVHLTC